jgi:glycosyltransferase involved in cell wall biosynthesis
MFNASVILCSHNPRPHYLTRVLSALKDQTLAKDRWELLLIDNASDKPLAPNYDLSWHRAAAHIKEPELGLAFARSAAERKVRGSSISIYHWTKRKNDVESRYQL